MKIPIEVHTGLSCPPEYQKRSEEDLVKSIRAVKSRLGSELVILGHHYQGDPIVVLSDFTGDSFKLCRDAADALTELARQAVEALHEETLPEPQRVAMALARHTDPRLTECTYMDESLLPVAEELSMLPPIPGPDDHVELRLMACCGNTANTEGAPVMRSIL